MSVNDPLVIGVLLNVKHIWVLIQNDHKNAIQKQQNTIQDCPNTPELVLCVVLDACYPHHPAGRWPFGPHQQPFNIAGANGWQNRRTRLSVTDVTTSQTVN